MEYVIHLAILVGIYLILAQSYNVAFGLGTLFNLAHVSAYAIGAYATALLATELGFGFFSCIAMSMIIAAFFSLLIGLIAIKLSHDHFALGTLAFSMIVTALLINWKNLTRGVLGIPGIPRPEIFGIDFYQNSNFLMLVAVVTFVSLLILYWVFNSKLSRSLRAQADSPIAAAALARNVRGVRNDAFIISSTFAGLAGALFAYYLNYIDPTSFELAEMVFVLSIVIIGKPGSFWGVIASTTFLVLLPEPLRFIGMSPHLVGPLRQFLYALILFEVVYAKRTTLFPVKRLI